MDTTQATLFGAGIAVIAVVLTLLGYRHRVLLGALLGAGILLILLGLFWHHLREVARITVETGDAAAVSWTAFIAIPLVSLACVAFLQWRFWQGRGHQPPPSPVAGQPTAEPAAPYSAATDFANRAPAPAAPPAVLSELQRAPCRRTLDMVQDLLDQGVASLVRDLLPCSTNDRNELPKLLRRSSNMVVKALALHADLKRISSDHSAPLSLLAVDLAPLLRALRGLVEPLRALDSAKNYPEPALNEALKPVARANNDVATVARNLTDVLEAKRNEHFSE